MSGMWGPDFAAGRGHNGARTTPAVETPGRARHGESPDRLLRPALVFLAAMLRLGQETGDAIWIPPISMLSG